MTTPEPLLRKTAADALVASLKDSNTVPMADYLAAVDEQRKAHRACEIFFKPPKGSTA